jgi:L-rhamnose mutarotase
MKKVAFKMKLIAGNEQEYKKRHDEIWPELSALLKQNGIADYSIFFDSTTLDLIGVLKIENQTNLDALPKEPIMQKWWAYMADIMETNPDNSPISVPLNEVFFME